MNREFLDKYPTYQDYFKNFLGGWSFEDGDKVLTITDINETEMYDQETGGTKIELTLHFAEESLPMVCNVTNAQTIATVLGTGEWSKWIGQQILVGTSKVRAFGKVHDAIRVRDRKPEVITCENCGQVIVPPAGRSVAQLVAKTRADYGKALCIDCAKKLKESGQ